MTHKLKVQCLVCFKSFQSETPMALVKSVDVCDPCRKAAEMGRRAMGMEPLTHDVFDEGGRFKKGFDMCLRKIKGE